MRRKGQVCHIMNNQEKNAYVRTMLVKTLVEMLKEKKLEEIPVRTLCERAGVARASFYRNYTSTADILHQECDRLIGEWGKAFESDPSSRPDNVFASLFDHYYKNSHFYKTLVQAGKGEYILETILNVCGPKTEMGNTQAYGQAYFAYGLYGWISEWIRRGMKEDGKELNAMIQAGLNH
jgi:AcrR family transcriptional regulator